MFCFFVGKFRKTVLLESKLCCTFEHSKTSEALAHYSIKSTNRAVSVFSAISYDTIQEENKTISETHCIKSRRLNLYQKP